VDVLKKSSDSLQTGLKQADSTIKVLDAAKADKKSQDTEIAKITTLLGTLEKEVKTLTSLRTDMNAVLSDMQRLENNIATQLADVAVNTEQSRKDVNQLQASIAALSNQKIDKDFFDLELLKLRKNYQQLVSQAISNLNSRLDMIQKKIDDIQKISNSDKQSGKAASSTAVPTGSATKTTTGSEAITSPPKSGTIVEQDIPE
jgi:chromosome segregation ATPase